MTPQAILTRAKSMGISLLVDGDQIRVRGPREAIEEMAPMVKRHKPELLAMLKPSRQAARIADTVFSGEGEGADMCAAFSTASSQSESDAGKIRAAVQKGDGLVALVLGVANAFECPPEEVSLLLNLAARDPIGMRRSFEIMARERGLEVPA